MTLWFLTASTPFGVLEQAFPGVTPSFHLSENQFFETIFFRSSFQSSFVLAPRLTFSVRNVSHPVLNPAHSMTIESFLVALKVWPWDHGCRDTIPDVFQCHGLPLGSLVLRVHKVLPADGTLDLIALETDVLDGIEHLDAVYLPVKFHWLTVDC
jgi:hypothetical protein